MKIVILDGYTENPGDLSWAQLEALGELTVYDRTPSDEDEIIRRIGGAEIVMTNKTPLMGKVLNACTNIKYITVLATGYNVVDTACARAKGIPVSNVPAYGTAAVGQFAIALLLEICHHVAHHSQAVHEGRWEACPDWCFWDYPLIDGRILGADLHQPNAGKNRLYEPQPSDDRSRRQTHGGTRELAGRTQQDLIYMQQTMRYMYLYVFAQSRPAFYKPGGFAVV